MSNGDTAFWTVESMSKALAAGETDAEELQRLASAAARQCAAPSVFIGLTEKRAGIEAGAAAERLSAGLSLGPFDGIPIAWKDLFDLAGEHTSAGSLTTRDESPARQDAEAVTHLRRAGSVCVGKTNTVEFAFSGIGINPHFGTPLNPWSPTVARVPGGSSCGSAVAVALGIVPVAIGTDTSGSVRVPAALNGLVGFRPGRSRISKRGVFTLSPTLDTVGPIVRTARDAALADAALRGLPSPCMPEGTPPEELCLVVPEGSLVDDIDDDVAMNFNATLERLASAGARVKRQRMPTLDAVAAAFDEFGTLVAIEAACTLKSRLEARSADRMDPRVRERLRTSATASAFALHSLLQSRQRLMQALVAELGQSLLVMPTTPEAAPDLQPILDCDALYTRTNARLLRNTMPGSFLDMPGLALPNGFDRRGMPTSVLLSARCGLDAAVLAAGIGIDQCLTDDQLRPLPPPVAFP